MAGQPQPAARVAKKFAYPHELVTHQKTYHMGEKNYKCDQCDMSFAKSLSLRRHYLRHSNVRDFKCDFCPKAFKCSKYLRVHTKIHLNDKRYVCKVCEDAFVQSGNLKYHMKKRHPNVPV